MPEDNARRFAGNAVIVSGAGGGIGAAVARRMVTEGATVVAVDVATPDRDWARHPALRWIAGDVAEETTWRRAIAAVDDVPLTALVSNAATVDVAALHDTTEDSWQRQLDVCLSGTYRAVRATLPLLRDVGGNIVITSSVHARVGLPGHPAYAAAKGALCALTRQLAVEYGPRVRVNTVIPGPVLTGMWDRVSPEQREQSARQTALGRLGKPEEVAACVAFLASHEASFVTGSEMVVDGGWSVSKDSA